MSPVDSAEKKQSVWDIWPKWTSDSQFNTERFRFSGSVSQYDGKTGDATIAILKHKQFIEIYREILNENTRFIFEIGFFQGGMPLFLADMSEPAKMTSQSNAKIVGIDYNPPSETLLKIIKDAGLQNHLKLHGNVLQDDVAGTKLLLDGEFGNQPLDLIIDDCSHEYRNTKICFQEYFGYLKPGGKYVIEDWGWQHWPGEPWQTDKSHFHGQPGMTNLIFELVMTLGTSPGVIARVDVVSEFCVVVTRGPKLAYRERLDLDTAYLTAGRPFTPMVGGLNAKSLLARTGAFPRGVPRNSNEWSAWVSSAVRKVRKGLGS